MDQVIVSARLQQNASFYIVIKKTSRCTIFKQNNPIQSPILQMWRVNQNELV